MLLCLLNEKPIEGEFHLLVVLTAFLVVLLQAQLLIPLDSIIDLLTHPQPTLGLQATFAGSVTALSWWFKVSTGRRKTQWDQAKLYRCSRHPALPSNEYVEAPSIVEKEPGETRTNVSLSHRCCTAEALPFLQENNHIFRQCKQNDPLVT